ncbi:MAG: CvpA family protein [Candidatus Margulisiibacteriota bacterium]
MNWLDIIILAIIALNVFLGFRRGLIKSVFGLLAMVIATMAAVRKVTWLATLIKAYIDFPDILLTTTAYIIIWIVTYFLVYTAGKLLSKAMHLTPIGFLDTFGGIVLGAVKGIIIVLIITVPLLTIPFISDHFEESARGSQFLTWYQPVIIWGRIIMKEYWPKKLTVPLYNKSADVINGFEI